MIEAVAAAAQHTQDPLVDFAQAMPGSSDWAPVLWLALLFVLQYVLISSYSRGALTRYARLYLSGGWRRLVAHLIGAPATAIHELAHAAMCVVTRSRIHKIVLWKPTVSEGSIGFGYVEHDQYRDWRGALVALAPGILIPPGLALYNFLLMGAALPGRDEIVETAPWITGLWILGLFIFTSSAFPSYQDFDNLGWTHWASIALMLVAAGGLIVLVGEWDALAELIAGIIQLLIPASIVAAAYLAFSGANRVR